MKTLLLMIAIWSAALSAFGQSQIGAKIEEVYDKGKYREVVHLVPKLNEFLMSEDREIAYDMIGRSYFNLLVYDSAVFFETKALAMDNDATATSGWAHTYKGMALYHLGKPKDAIRDLQASINFNRSQDATALAKEFLGEINTGCLPNDSCRYYISQSDYNAAIESGKRELQTNKCKRIMELIGIAYAQLHDYDSTAYFENAALNLDKDSTFVSDFAHLYLGIAFYNTHQKDKALTEFQIVIENAKLSTASREAEVWLGNIASGRSMAIDSIHQSIKEKLSTRDYRSAATLALECAFTRPDDALAWDQLSSAYNGLHRFDSAINCGRKAIELDGNRSMISSEAHYHLGQAYYMKRDEEAASAEWKAATNGHANNTLIDRVKHARMLTGLDGAYRRWRTVEKSNIVFHFQRKRNATDPNVLMENAMNEYGAATQVLLKRLPKKIDIFVWENAAMKAKGLALSKANNTSVYPDYCVIHMTGDDNSSSPITEVVGAWQRAL